VARTYYVMELIPGYDLAALVNYHEMTPKTLWFCVGGRFTGDRLNDIH